MIYQVKHDNGNVINYNERQLRELAQYYHNNECGLEEIDECLYLYAKLKDVIDYIEQSEKVTVIDDTKYTVEESFNHFDNGELMFRVKITYKSGGIDYTVVNKEQLENMGISLCPSCNKNELKGHGRNALSRKDNETEICSDCGTKEALEEFLKFHD